MFCLHYMWAEVWWLVNIWPPVGIKVLSFFFFFFFFFFFNSDAISTHKCICTCGGIAMWLFSPGYRKYNQVVLMPKPNQNVTAKKKEQKMCLTHVLSSHLLRTFYPLGSNWPGLFWLLIMHDDHIFLFSLFSEHISYISNIYFTLIFVIYGMIVLIYIKLYLIFEENSAEILNYFHYGYDHRHKSRWNITDWYMSKFSQDFFFFFNHLIFLNGSK